MGWGGGAAPRMNSLRGYDKPNACWRLAVPHSQPYVLGVNYYASIWLGNPQTILTCSCARGRPDSAVRIILQHGFAAALVSNLSSSFNMVKNFEKLRFDSMQSLVGGFLESLKTHPATRNVGLPPKVFTKPEVVPDDLFTTNKYLFSLTTIL